MTRFQPLKSLCCSLASHTGKRLNQLPPSAWHCQFTTAPSSYPAHPPVYGLGVKGFQTWGHVPSCHKEPEPSVPEVEESSLPLPQRCKSMLAANWRGQLTTIRADSNVQDVSALRGSLAPFVLLDGKPLVWLPEDSAHSHDLQKDAKGSLMVGHTDPPALAHLFRKAAHSLPRVVVLGELVPVPESEVKYVRRRASKAAASAGQSGKSLAPELANLLSKGQWTLDERKETLSPLLEAGDSTGNLPSDPPGVLYRLLPREFAHMDIMGKRHTISAEDVTGALTDPLAYVQASLVEGINQDLDRRKALVLFCAAHLQIHVKEAYLFSVDRWGFDLLALPAEKVENPEEGHNSWRAFRFAFSRELQDANAFGKLFVEMEREVSLALVKEAQ